MDVNMKQHEIETAIKEWLIRQGISLHGKVVAIDFTSGRGNNGLSAAVTITAAEIPGFSDEAGDGSDLQAKIAAQVTSGSGPSPAVKAMLDMQPKLAASTTVGITPDGTVSGVVTQEPETNTGTLKEGAEALLVPSDSPAAAAILQEQPVEAVAEAKVAEPVPVAAAEAQAEVAKPTTTSLFGGIPG